METISDTGISLGARLRQLRLSRGFTQVMVADMGEFSATTYQRWESDGNRPQIPEIQKLAQLYGISIDTLLMGVSLKKQ